MSPKLFDNLGRSPTKNILGLFPIQSYLELMYRKILYHVMELMELLGLNRKNEFGALEQYAEFIVFFE